MTCFNQFALLRNGHCEPGILCLPVKQDKSSSASRQVAQNAPRSDIRGQILPERNALAL